jgi:glycosyltransferase involved in cell wall biosynthesis
MPNTTFDLAEKDRARLAQPLPNDPLTGKPQKVDIHTQKVKFDCGGSCAYSTAGDYIRFGQMLLNGGSLEGKRVLGPQTVAFMTSNHLNKDIKNTKYRAFCKQCESKYNESYRKKNIEFLIDVLKKILSNNPETILIISGDGPIRKELEEYAVFNGVSENIVFTGFIERFNLKNLYAMADIFVFASKVESQGMVLLESMSCGTPVVAIGKMGTREVMGGDFGGFMVDDDIDFFAERVQELLTQKDLCNIKSKEALVHIEKWTIDLQAVKMINLYESLCSQKNA